MYSVRWLLGISLQMIVIYLMCLNWTLVHLVLGSITEICSIGNATVLTRLIEPVREKTNNLGSDRIRHKLGCAVAEDG